MTRIAIALSVALALPCGPAAAAPAKKAAKGKAAQTAPAASADELNKLKGDFKWGMSPEDIATKVQDRIRASYDEKLQKTANDPTRQDRVRKEMMAELDKVKSKVIKFDGQKTGYDVSIVDQEFLHNTSESMLVAKEATSSRYFFFANEKLYKMFIAFDKEMLQGKSFREFGQLMQAKYGKAREVNVEEKSKAGVKVKLDHYVWSSKSGDMLRLVDRSEFYDVYCLVIYDGAVAKQQDETRKSRATGDKKDSLVEAVTTGGKDDRDGNDNIIDQITGKQTLKPGEHRAKEIVVPSPTGGVRAPTPDEVNRKEPASERTSAPDTKGSKKKESAGSAETKGIAL
jgi:hypothetical protein